MAHGGHHADDGPSAKRYMDTEGTGLSPSTAAFIAANCSPFTHPTDLPAPAKVPDNKATMLTCTAFMTDHFQIPTVTNTTNTTAGQMLIVNANPMAALPIVWNTSFTQGTQRMDPGIWATRYEAAGLSNLVAQIKSLSQESLRHRVVGCGVKAWVSQTSNIARGTLEAGQFVVADTKQTRDLVPSARYFTVGGGSRAGYHGSTSPFTYPTNSGYLGEALMDDSLVGMRNCLRSARTQRKGLLSADDGATVRWTPDREYSFVPTINRNVVVPLLPYHSSGFPASKATNYIDSGGLNTGTQPIVRILDNTSQFNDDPDGVIDVVGDTSAYYSSTTITTTGSYSPGWFVPPVELGTARVPTELGTLRRHMYGNNANNSIDPPQYLFGASDTDYYPNALIDIGDSAAMAYMDEAQNFVHGLYIDMTGLEPGQFVDVQVVWHIEYVPKEGSLNTGLPSPVDMNWPMIEAMVSNPEAFPVVVKGHSFFSSLLHGIKAAGSAIGGILRGASSVAALVPDPRAQAFAGGAGIIGGGLTRLFG